MKDELRSTAPIPGETGSSSDADLPLDHHPKSINIHLGNNLGAIHVSKNYSRGRNRGDRIFVRNDRERVAHEHVQVSRPTTSKWRTTPTGSTITKRTTP